MTVTPYKLHFYNNHISFGQRAELDLNFKRAVSNVNKCEKMFAVSCMDANRSSAHANEALGQSAINGKVLIIISL